MFPANDNNLPSGKYVLYQDNHFCGFRVFEDGSCRIQSSHRPHEGTIYSTVKSARLARFEQIFQIIPRSDQEKLITCTLDARGGSESPHSPTRQSELALLGRLDWLENVRFDFKTLLAYDCCVWESLPSPFSPLSESEWWADATATQSKLVKLADINSEQISRVSVSDVARVNKRLRIYISLGREFSRVLSQSSMPLAILPNPCECSVSKRSWESACFCQRQELKAMAKMIDDKSVNTTLCTSPEAAHRMFTDVKGGSTTIRTDKLGGSLAEVQVIHACSGEEMCTLSLNDAPGVETSVAHIRREVATQVQAPFFSVKLLAGGEILSDFETWENTQRLKLLQVIKTPVHDNDTDALFTAIRSDNVWKVRALLIAGQCPNALYDGFPPLVYSCIFGKSEVVGQTLLEGGSDVHVVGEGLSALEASVLAGYTRLSEEIVEAGADPHTVNGRGATCLHGAAAFGRLGCARVLLAAGADALQEDMEGDTPFSVCRESAAVKALLMDASWPRLTMKHIFVKNMEEYANYLQPSELQSLWMCCSAFKKQSVFFTDISSALFDVQGGALAETDVDITSALSGELLLRARLAPEQQSENLSHIVRSAASSFFALPHFCVEVCCRAFDSWLDLGSPSSVSIVIKPPTLEYTEDLITAIQASDAAEVFRVLKAGQNPNCVLLDAPLTWAVELGRLSIVKALIQGNADVNFVPIGRHGPLHGAAMHDRPGEAAMLLAHGANPNLTDHQGNNPLHYALLHSLTTFHVLLSSGADALQENRDKNTAFSMVPAGELTFLCLCFCYDNVHPRHVLHRHLHLLADLCCTKSLLAASSAFSKQRVALDVDVLGGSTAQVPNAFQINVHNYLLGSARMADSGRAWRQLAEFMKRVSPVMGTIKRYPYLFWILPVPFDGRQTVDEWRVRLTAACFFIRTLHNQNFVKLEAAMIAWFWPEIAKDLSLLDVVSTRQLAVSSRHRVRMLSRALLCLSIISFAGCAHRSPPGLTSAPTCVFHRRFRLNLAVRAYNQAAAAQKKSDAYGGASQNRQNLSELEASTIAHNKLVARHTKRRRMEMTALCATTTRQISSTKRIGEGLLCKSGMSNVMPEFLLQASVRSTSIEDVTQADQVPIIDHFQVLHAHTRDDALTFHPDTHTHITSMELRHRGASLA